MYSWEIGNVMKQNNYVLSTNTYINICSTSTQINHIRYEASGDYFEICTDDSYYWKFQVKKGS